MFQTILFDLDGTLTDPGIGITNSVMYALKKYGIHVLDRTELYPFIGPPLTGSFERFYGFDHVQAVEAVGFYREYFREKGIFENRPYDGIQQLLDRLQKAGKRLLVATSKPGDFAREILQHFKLYDYFELVAGSNLDGSRTGKSEVISYALEKSGIDAGDSVIMVGDREHDVLGAKEKGIASLGVLYGYGTREELLLAGADYLAENVEDVGKVLFEEFDRGKEG